MLDAILILFYEIGSKIVTVTADNAANEKKALRDMGLIHIGCFAHGLNLVIQNLLGSQPQLMSLKEKVTKVVSLTRQSPAAKERFEKCQTSTPILKLVQAVPHRWNSLFSSLERMILLKPSVILFMADEDGLDNFTFEDWNNMANVVRLLRPIYDITVELSSENHSTISKVIPLSNLLIQFYKHESQESPSGSISKDISTQLHKELASRLGQVEETHVLGLATILDPRFKNKLFQRPDRVARTLKLLNDEAIKLAETSDANDVEPVLKKAKQVIASVFEHIK